MHVIALKYSEGSADVVPRTAEVGDDLRDAPKTASHGPEKRCSVLVKQQVLLLGVCALVLLKTNSK